MATPRCSSTRASSTRPPAPCPRPSRPTTRSSPLILGLLTRTIGEDPQRWTRTAADIKGVTEETTTGVHRLYEFARDGKLLFPAINVNDSVTKSKFDNLYGCRHSLIDGINRGTDVMIAGKTAVILGYGDVGKGCAESLRGQGARVLVTEVDPICALQAAMEGYQVVRLEDVVESADIFITATGNYNIITAADMSRMKHQAIVGNIGHFDNEIDMAGLAKVDGRRADQHQAAGRQVGLRRRPRDHRAVGGPPAEPRQRDRSPELRDVVVVLEPDDRADRAVHEDRRVRQAASTSCPKHLDEKVARLHLDALGAKLTELRPEQAAYIGVPVEGPYKPDHYRY